MRKKVLSTINPKWVLSNLERLTSKGLVQTLNDNSDARFVDSHVDSYDFKNNKVRTMAYENEKFIDKGFETPSADFWIFYSYGSYDNIRKYTKKLGCSNEAEYQKKILSFLENQIRNGNVGEIINSPDTERKTLKSYLEKLDPHDYNIIPTYTFDNFDRFYDKFSEKKILVSKPDCGQGMQDVKLISSDMDAMRYRDADFSHLVFQDYHPGVEKRMWIAGGEFVEGRLIGDRNTPWKTHKGNSFVSYYNERTVRENNWDIEEFNRDVFYANKLAKEVNLLVGSIDYLGDKINEINGAGTGFTGSDRANTIKLDARGHLYEYFKSILS